MISKKQFLLSLLLSNICLVSAGVHPEVIAKILAGCDAEQLEAALSSEIDPRASYFCTRPEKPNITDITDRMHNFSTQEFNGDSALWDDEDGIFDARDF